MTITTTQKIIKIGSSRGVTIPAKQLQELQLSDGDKVRVTIEAVRPSITVAQEYADFKKQYGQTLKNLANR